MIICGLNSVNLIWLYLACVYRGRDDKIIRIVKIAGLHRTSSQWWWLRLCKVPKRLFCLARSWCEYRSSRQIWKKVIWAFVNLNSYSMLRAATKVLVIPNLLSTCKAPVIEKIRFKVTWWTLLLCVCGFSYATAPDVDALSLDCASAQNFEWWTEIISIFDIPFICPN